MTQQEHPLLRGAKVYQQPTVNNTPIERRPNNGIYTIEHFSKRVTLRKYEASNGWMCSGLADAGEPTLLDFWCVIIATNSVSNGIERTRIGNKLSATGEYSEGAWKLFYDPEYIKHESPIYLQIADEENGDYSGFADVIEYQNKLWIVREHRLHDVAYDDNERWIGEATIERWAEPVGTNPSQAQVVGGHYGG